MARRKHSNRAVRRNFMLRTALIILAAGFALNILVYLTPTDVQEIDMHLSVADYAGFNVDTSALYFGTVMPGGYASRNIIVANHGTSPTRVELRPAGDLGPLTSLSERSFTVNPGESKTIEVTVTSLATMPYGNYTGKLLILYFR